MQYPVCGHPGADDSLGDVKSEYARLVRESAIRCGVPVATRASEFATPESGSVEIYVTKGAKEKKTMEENGAVGLFFGCFSKLHTRGWKREKTAYDYLKARYAEGFRANGTIWCCENFGEDETKAAVKRLNDEKSN